MTPHNEAAPGDYAPTVLLSGDPLRSAWIAETLLQDARCVNRIRGALGYTGSYGGMPVSVQTTGIGIPSLAIYVHELLAFYGARTLLRVGTCGGLQDHVRIREIVISRQVGADDVGDRQALPERFLSPDPVLLGTALVHAGKLEVPYHVGLTVSSSDFYHPAGIERCRPLRAQGVLAIDMETHGLYALAEQFGARALSVCTVVDNVFTREAIAEFERQALFRPMCELALATAHEASG